MTKTDQTIPTTRPTSIRALYEEYADMLLGYIFEIVKDREVAEEYLVKVFEEIASIPFDKLSGDETNTWCRLLSIAKEKLSAFNNTVEDCEDGAAVVVAHSPNKYLDQMTEMQKRIFCNFYYQKKTTLQLSAELNEPEAAIKKSLREAFTIIRASHGN
jgi:hypothetical protein